MDPEVVRPIKKALLAEYRHFADKRLRDIDRAKRFIVDDRESKQPSFGSGGVPFGWFCQMFADVHAPDSVELTIRGPLPMGPEVEAWMQRNGMQDDQRFEFGPKNADELLVLAAAMRAVGRRAKRSNSDCYMGPRIASCLARLHRALTQYWKTVSNNLVPNSGA
jgi:hypothetical protein